MQKLTVLIGLPGSGKSTWALEELKRDVNTVRVNRDSLRLMLHGSRKWSGTREKSTIAAETSIVLTALTNGLNVIVDDTNLTQSNIDHWRHGATNYVRFEVKDFRDIPIAECIHRDFFRPDNARVGRGVIERMALFNGMIDLSGYDKVAIVDIDGTLSDLKHRLHYIETAPKNYDGFFDDVDLDDVFKPIWNAVVELQASGHKIIILSGRPTTCGVKTADWLNGLEYSTEGLPELLYDHLFMRQGGDHRPDDQVKRQIMEWMFAAGLRKDAIKIVLDDRDSVCAVWNAMDLPLIKVASGKAVSVHPRASDLFFQLGIPT